MSNRRLLHSVSHVQVEQLLVEARLLGQASLGQHFRCQHRSEWLFFLRRKLLLGEGLGCGTLRFTHAGETHLLRFTLCLLFRNQRLDRTQFFLLLLGCFHHRLSFDRRGFGQPNVIRTVDEFLFPLGQVGVGEPFAFERLHKHLADVVGFSFNDWQQDLEAVVLRCFLLFTLYLTSQFGKVRLKLQTFFFRPDFGGFTLVLCVQFFDLLSFLQIGNHVAGLSVPLSPWLQVKFLLYSSGCLLHLQFKVCWSLALWPFDLRKLNQCTVTLAWVQLTLSSYGVFLTQARCRILWSVLVFELGFFISGQVLTGHCHGAVRKRDRSKRSLAS